MVGEVLNNDKQSWAKTVHAAFTKARDRAQAADVTELKLRVVAEELLPVRHSLKPKKTAQPWRWDMLDTVLLPSSPLAQEFNQIKANQNDELDNSKTLATSNASKPNLEQSVSKQTNSPEEQLSKSMVKLMKIATKPGRPSKASTLQSDCFFSFNESANADNENEPISDEDTSHAEFDQSPNQKRLSSIKPRSAVTINKYQPEALNNSAVEPQSNDVKATLSLSFNIGNRRSCLPKLTKRSKSMHLNTLIDLKEPGSKSSSSLFNRSSKLLQKSSTPKPKQPLTAFSPKQTPITDEKFLSTSSKSSKIYEDITPTVTSNSFVYECPSFGDGNISGVGVLEPPNDNETSEGSLGVNTDYWSPIYCSNTGTDGSDISTAEALHTPKSTVKKSKSLTQNKSTTLKEKHLKNKSMQDIMARRSSRKGTSFAEMKDQSWKSDVETNTSTNKSLKLNATNKRKTLLTSIKKQSLSTIDLTDSPMLTTTKSNETLESSDDEFIASAMEVVPSRSSRRSENMEGIQYRRSCNISKSDVEDNASQRGLSKLKTLVVTQSPKCHNVSNRKSPSSSVKKSSSTKDLRSSYIQNTNSSGDEESLDPNTEMQDTEMKMRRSSRKNTSFASSTNDPKDSSMRHTISKSNDTVESSDEEILDMDTQDVIKSKRSSRKNASLLNVSSDNVENAVSTSDVENNTSKLETPNVTHSPKLQNASSRKTQRSNRKRSSSAKDLRDTSMKNAIYTPNDFLSSDEELLDTTTEMQDIEMKRRYRKSANLAGAQDRNLFNVSIDHTPKANVSKSEVGNKFKTPDVTQSTQFKNTSNRKTSVRKQSSSTNDLKDSSMQHTISKSNDTLESSDEEILDTATEAQDVIMKSKRISRKNASLAEKQGRSLLNALTDNTENANVSTSDVDNNTSKLKTPNVTHSAQFQNASSRKTQTSARKRSSSAKALRDSSMKNVIYTPNDFLSSDEELLDTNTEIQDIEMTKRYRKSAILDGTRDRSSFNVLIDDTPKVDVSKSEVRNKFKTPDGTRSTQFKNTPNRRTLSTSVRKQSSSTNNRKDSSMQHTMFKSNDTLESSDEEILDTTIERQDAVMKSRRSSRKNASLAGIQSTSLLNVSTENANVSISDVKNNTSKLKTPNVTHSPKFQNESSRKTPTSARKRSSSAKALRDSSMTNAVYTPNDFLSSDEELLDTTTEIQDIEMTKRRYRKSAILDGTRDRSSFNVLIDDTPKANVSKAEVGNKFKTPDGTRSTQFKNTSNRKALSTSVRKQSSSENDLKDSSMQNIISKSNDTFESSDEELFDANAEMQCAETKTRPSTNLTGIEDNRIFNVSTDNTPNVNLSKSDVSTSTRRTRSAITTSKLINKFGPSAEKVVTSTKTTRVKISKNNAVPSEPLNDLSDVKGVKKLLKTPKPVKEPRNDLRDVAGVKAMFLTLKEQNSPNNDLTDVRGVRKLLKTPKLQTEPLNDLENVSGLKKLFVSTTKNQRSPVNDLSDIKGVRRLLKTPKPIKPPTNDLTDVTGVKKLFGSITTPISPNNHLSVVGGASNVIKTPQKSSQDLNKAYNINHSFKKKSPMNDLSNIEGVKPLITTPKNSKSPKDDLPDLFRDDFDKLIGKEPLRQYPGRSSPTKVSPMAKRKTVLESSINQNSHVERWIQEQTISMPNTSTPIIKGKIGKFIPDFISSQIQSDNSKRNDSVPVQKSKKTTKLNSKRQLRKKADDRDGSVTTGEEPKDEEKGKRILRTRAMKKDHEENTDQSDVIKPKVTRGRKPKVENDNNLQEVVKASPLNAKRTRARDVPEDKPQLSGVEVDKENIPVTSKRKRNIKNVVTINSSPENIKQKEIHNKVSPRKTRSRNNNKQDTKVTSDLDKRKTSLDSSIKHNSHIEEPDVVFSEIQTDNSKRDDSIIPVQKTKKTQPKRQLRKKTEGGDESATTSEKPKDEMGKRNMRTRAIKKDITLEKDDEKKADKNDVKPRATRGRKPKVDSNLQEVVQASPVIVKRTRARDVSEDTPQLGGVDDNKENIPVKEVKSKSKSNSKKVVAIDSRTEVTKQKEINNDVSPRKTRSRNNNKQDKKVASDSDKATSVRDEIKAPTHSRLRAKNDDSHKDSIIVLDSSSSSDEGKSKPSRLMRSKKNDEPDNKVRGFKRKGRIVESHTEDENDVEGRVSKPSSIQNDEQTHQRKRIKRGVQIEDEKSLSHTKLEPPKKNVNVPLKRQTRKRGTKI
ncbi:hypothetical protein RN001_011507 [Aquatica leii]|uniref:Uncharacterized protein n=1 Tax=Aquatica leii TaxID=1421715 RepID=A0AAN7SP39_9COLE|nr:hypothetical protein RN001_011507 [Aquatica leii]